MLERKGDEIRQETADERVRDARRAAEYAKRDSDQLWQLANLIAMFRPFLARNLPSCDEARAFFSRLDNLYPFKTSPGARVLPTIE